MVAMLINDADDVVSPWNAPRRKSCIALSLEPLTIHESVNSLLLDTLLTPSLPNLVYLALYMLQLLNKHCLVFGALILALLKSGLSITRFYNSDN